MFIRLATGCSTLHSNGWLYFSDYHHHHSLPVTLACHTTGISTTLNPIEGELGGILLFRYSMIYGPTFSDFKASCEDRSPTQIPPPGIMLI